MNRATPHPAAWFAALTAVTSCGQAHPEDRAPPQCVAAESIAVPTEDGATVRLHHHPGDGPPVLVVHGVSSNHRCWDLDADRSLAVALTDAGYDAWLLDLRGHGDARDDATGAASRRGWVVDDYGRFDLPAAITHIQRATGERRVGYVGHSMGGMVALIYASIYGDDALASLVVVGSPIDFGDPDPLLTLGSWSMRAGMLLPQIPSPTAGRLVSDLNVLPFHADEMIFARDGFTPESRARMLRNVASPMYDGELDQFSAIVSNGAFTSMDGQVAYLDTLPTLQVPILAIAGRADRVAPPDRVRAWVSLSGSDQKRFVLAGRANGFGHDYGHVDLPVGDDAAAEIYPEIIGWLNDTWR